MAMRMKKSMMAMTIMSTCLSHSVESEITPTTEPNMNGEYLLQATPNQKSIDWSTNFSDYPGGVEYFEVYAGPITTTYAEVFWTGLPEVPVPEAIAKRFAGKGMAVVGFEADQVRRTAKGDVSVPINVAYNHHYGATLIGTGSHMETVKVQQNPDHRVHHPGPNPGYEDVPVEHEPSTSGLPTSLQFGYSNGGEFRKTYHALAPPFAQLIESPTHVRVSPMQIDTWNRDEMNLTGGKFVAGPAPKHSFAPVSGQDAIYSGLLECPITTRIRKHLTGGGWNDSTVPEIYNCAPKSTNQCPSDMSVESCFSAATKMPELTTMKLSMSNGSSTELPSGCSVVVDTTNNTAKLFYNTNKKSTACCGNGITTIVGAQSTLMGNVSLSLSLSVATNTATISINGPADGSWFGIGFDTISMSNSPYAIIIDGSGNTTEHVMGEHAAGVQINSSVVIKSNTVANGMRTVTMTRPLVGVTPQHHTFNPYQLRLNFISAVGSTPTLSYHKAKETSSVTMWPIVEAAVCVCDVPAAPFGQGAGTLEYLPTGENIGFPLRCNLGSADYSVMKNQNPTCDIRTYVGGLSTCHHGWHLLDADQDVPWPNQPITYYMKYRLYFQEYVPPSPQVPASHIAAFDITWSIAGATGEYDVPQCAPGTPTEKCIHEISGTITPPGNDYHFVAAHYHCHAPTCLSMEIWNNRTGELLCKEVPYHGAAPGIQQKDRFDEPGYIAQRICLWGLHPPFEKPPLVSGETLWVKSVTNSTYGHHGEMALPQMLLASIPTSN